MRFVSLFAGVGGFDLGFDRAGMECVGQVEVDVRRSEILAEHWPDVLRYGDIQNVDGREFGDVDVVCGGFPCQDLSRAGRGAGLAGGQSGLWWEFARVIEGARPEWVVVENVSTLLSSNGGRDMGAVIGSLGEMGYGFCWRVFDSQWFGVAQRRKRVFIVGRAGGGSGPGEVLLEPEGLQRDFVPSGEAQTGSAGSSTRSPGPSGEPVSVHTDQNPVTAVGLSPALTRQETASVAVLVDGRFRKLTPLEYERLQGFPDGWTASLSRRQRYMALGDAATVPVVEWIGCRLAKVG